MSSFLLKKLAGYSPESAEVAPTYVAPDSIEATEEYPLPTSAQELYEQTEELAEKIDDDSSDIAEIVTQIESHSADIAKGCDVVGAVENVVDQTIATYGDAGITEQGATLLQASVESILIAAGIPIPSKVVVPSFEGKTRVQYSTEAEEKKSGFVKRILEWIVKTFNSIMEAVKDFWSRLINSVKSLRSYAQRVRVRVKAVKGSPKNEKISVGGWITMCTTDGKTAIDKPSKVIDENTKKYQEFSKAWDGVFAQIRDINPPSLDSPSFIRYVEEKLREGTFKSHIQHLNGLKPLVTHEVEFKAGPDARWPLAGAKYNLKKTAGEGPKEAKTLLDGEMDDGVGAVLRALDMIEKIQSMTTAWEKSAKTVTSWATKVKYTLRSPDENVQAALKGLVRSASSAVGLMSAGWSTTISAFLTMLKSNLRYISISADQFSAADPKIKTMDDTSHNRRLPNGVAGQEGSGVSDKDFLNTRI